MGNLLDGLQVFIHICTVKCAIHLLCRNLTEVVKGVWWAWKSWVGL